MTVRILHGDCRDVLASLPADSVHCCVTSPPYFGLRDYKIPPSVWGGDSACDHDWSAVEPGPVVGRKDAGRRASRGSFADDEWREDWSGGGRQARAAGDNFCARCEAWLGTFGLEPTWRFYVEHAVEVFRAVRRVLRPDGTLWLNIGDSYASSPGQGAVPGEGGQSNRTGRGNRDGAAGKHGYAGLGVLEQPNRKVQPGLKPKDLMGIPWRVAFALQEDGWWLRQDIIWAKPNPMPESVTDRCTKSHEYLFLLSKSARYYFDAEAIKEAAGGEDHWRNADSPSPSHVPATGPHRGLHKKTGANSGLNVDHVPRGRKSGNKSHKGTAEYEHSDSEEHRTKAGLLKIADTAYPLRNKRSVWTVAPLPFPEAHFATFPPALIEPCVLAGTSGKGCCAKCGAPWVRQTKATFIPQPDVSVDKGIKGAGDQKPMDESNGWQGFPRGSTRCETLGWSPSCTCDAPAIPCTVLDLFGGSGTTGLVADRLQRDAILIDLNPAYVAMARERIASDAPLLMPVEAAL